MLASELGQASLALALVRFPMASRIASQALAFDAGVLDSCHGLTLQQFYDLYKGDVNESAVHGHSPGTL